ncbi:hypothetical protein EJK17_05915 [Lactobacillus xujianguonis]|uniref:Uncharacterized protein n=1 Tax=Lactobacillus xujianguonis TaxID=2495899 RepID=A0A437SV28_9LACO|nr:hypothetical protein EJK17_05915 [Lactobacillus xujianguonis]RVU74001.1 hypothetical protein EJK20_05300 [Lactobacillus xujianguonis]
MRKEVKLGIVLPNNLIFVKSWEYNPNSCYINFLKRHQNKEIIKVVSGIKGVGKTTLFLLFREYLKDNGVSSDQIITINFQQTEKLLNFIWRESCRAC